METRPSPLLHRQPLPRASCLRTSPPSPHRPRKSVHFDWHLPTIIRSTSPSMYSNCQSTFAVASSSLSTGNSGGNNDKQRKNFNGETVQEEKKRKKNKKIETTRRTIITSIPLTTGTIHRSLSPSPSPPPPPPPSHAKEKNNHDSRRRHREEREENVDELNCITSRRVTAATHLHCPTPSTFDHVSQQRASKNEANGTNDRRRRLSSRNDPIAISLPSFARAIHDVYRSFLDERVTPLPTKSGHSPASTSTMATKKFLDTTGFFQFIQRTNSSQPRSTCPEESKQLRRTSSTQRKSSKQLPGHGNKRLSADVECSPPSFKQVSNEDTNKVTVSRQHEQLLTTDNNAHSSSNTGKYIKEGREKRERESSPR